MNRHTEVVKKTRLTRFERRVLRAVLQSKKRSEPSLCRQFGGSARPDVHRATEDALFCLVQLGRVEWFGRNDRPLWYRVAGSSK